jgi:hypothetical protein
VEGDERPPSPLRPDAVCQKRVGTRQVAALGQADPQLEREVATGGVIIRKQRHGSLEQADRRANIASR